MSSHERSSDDEDYIYRKGGGEEEERRRGGEGREVRLSVLSVRLFIIIYRFFEK